MSKKGLLTRPNSNSQAIIQTETLHVVFLLAIVPETIFKTKHKIIHCV